MVKGLIGRKVRMTQIFEETGKAIPVTVIEAGPCPIVQVKTQERDGYQAVQLGFGARKEHKFNNPLKGHFAKVMTRKPGASRDHSREFYVLARSYGL